MKRPIVLGYHTNDLTTIHIHSSDDYPIRYIKIYKGNQMVGVFEPIKQFHMMNHDRKPITVVTVMTDGKRNIRTIEQSKRTDEKSRDFKPGDILVACDNFGDFLPPGYMGHAAIVINRSQIVEAVTSEPQVRKSSIQDFIMIHPRHIHLRCKDGKIGKEAAEYAKKYLEIFNENLEAGKYVPPFSFSTQIPLDDPWEGIYCSKLVWLCYYYGANMMFENDFYLFAPEDLATSLEVDDRFEVIYKHQDFKFHINL